MPSPNDRAQPASARPLKPAVVYGTGTAFVLVRYPYRKTPDLYVAFKDSPVFCAQCKAEFPVADFPSHVDSHDRRKRKPA